MGQLLQKDTTSLWGGGSIPYLLRQLLFPLILAVLISQSVSSPVILSDGKDIEPQYVYDRRTVNWEAYFRTLKLLRNFTGVSCVLIFAGAPFVGTAACITSAALFLAGAARPLRRSLYGREANAYPSNLHLRHEYIHHFTYQPGGSSTLKQLELIYKLSGNPLLVAEHKCAEVDCFSAYCSNFTHPEHESRVVNTFHVQSNAKIVASGASTDAIQDESSKRDTQPLYGERVTDGPIVMEYTWYDKGAANEDAMAHDPGFPDAFGWTVGYADFQKVGAYCFNWFDDDEGIRAITCFRVLERGKKFQRRRSV